MNGKGISAVVGIILMVAIVIAIAAVVYAFVVNQQHTINDASSIDMRIMNYSTYDNGSLEINLGFINNDSQINGNITIEVEKLIVDHRKEIDHGFTFTKIVQITIDNGATEQTIAEPAQLDKNYNYRISVSLTTQYKQYQRQSFYMFAE